MNDLNNAGDHGSMFVSDPNDTPVHQDPIVEPKEPEAQGEPNQQVQDPQEPELQSPQEPVIPEIDDNLWPEGHPDEETPGSEEKPNKENPSRFEYWQSQFSKEQAKLKEVEVEAQKLREEQQNLQAYAPVAEYFKANPQAIDYLEEKIRNEQGLPSQQLPSSPQGQPGVTQSEPPQKPERPQRPSDYKFAEREIEGTTSFDYAVATDNYNESMMDYRDAIETYETEQRRIVEDQQRQVYFQQKSIEDARNRMSNDFNMSPQQIQDYQNLSKEIAQDPLKHEIAYWQMIRGQQSVTQDQRTTNFLNNETKITVPPPVGVQSGQPTHVETSLEDDINNSFLSRGRGRTRF